MTATQSDPFVIDYSATKPTPFGRLVGVELRKTSDTRSGRWLLGAIVAVTALVMVIFFAVSDAADRVFENFAAVAATPQGFLLPVLGILLVTSEWSQRTAMVTFALEPSRTKVVAAKTVAALLLGLVAFVVAVALAGLATLAGGAEDGFGGVTAGVLGLFLLLQLMTIIQGLAYGMLFLNSPAAIVVFFVLPVVSSIVFNLVSWLRDIAEWIDLGTAQAPLFEVTDQGLTGDQWAQLGTTSLIWIVVPFIVGWFRIMRAEVK